ncbi:TATA box-binding protein-associated factor RNA polymerase I subunit B [Salarias fasciatus]|uniref:TATA box-binding protein-associated factor RNA polymerase I subunit B n=1 Tax=Salarias fasciatus TaxID=181472 RepID=A0A672IWE8_SALFA|nr:TATA box-binding protein-associated factor RNA polymerase I subunit B [Salarias fasciatus]
MDAQDTESFRESCPQCSQVHWGVSGDGRFYCRSCYTEVERSREVEEVVKDQSSGRVTRINKGPRTKRDDGGLAWRVCEAFQFILKNQADALLQLGVSPGFKDLVLCRMWRIYLQRSRQAYTLSPGAARQGGPVSDSDSAVDSSVWSGGFSESNPRSDADSQPESGCDWSGSADAASYLKTRRSGGRMTMRRTLALVHLALVWSRQALTLSDLLRLVQDGLVPYLKAYELLPDQMRLRGLDLLLFRVESVPPYAPVHQDAQDLVRFLQLPAFPPISTETPLHPAPLSRRLLLDANLPDRLHPWVLRLTEAAGLAGPEPHTLDPVLVPRPVLPRYELQAAALVLLVLKTLFGLDDRTEWDLSSRDLGDSGESRSRLQTGPVPQPEAGSSPSSTEDTFHLRRWFRLLQTALSRRRRDAARDAARTQWKSNKMVFRRRRDRHWAVKKRRTAEQVQACFERLSSCPAGVQTVAPSSFRFCWGDGDGADGPSMHHMKLDRVLTLKNGVPVPSNTVYWHPALRPCTDRLCRADHFLPELEAELPQSFSWTLQLFSVLLGVEPAAVLQEVLSVERRLLSGRTPGTGTGTGTLRRGQSSTRVQSSTAKPHGGF